MNTSVGDLSPVAKVILDRYQQPYVAAVLALGKTLSNSGTQAAAIRHEVFFFSLFMIDSYLARNGCEAAARSITFRKLSDSYFASITGQGTRELEPILDNRMEQYANAFNPPRPQSIDAVTDIHCQLVTKAMKYGTCEIYQHGKSAVETELLLLANVQQLYMNATSALIDSLPLLKVGFVSNQAPRPNPSEATLNARFCHDGLPAVLFAGKPETVERFFSSPEPSVRQLWDFCANQFKVRNSNSFFAAVHERPNVKVILVSLPKPERPTDCFFAAIVFHYGKKLFSSRVRSTKYYTLEFGRDVRSNCEIQFICKWDTAQQHSNLGQVADCTANTFLQRVLQSELV